MSPMSAIRRFRRPWRQRSSGSCLCTTSRREPPRYTSHPRSRRRSPGEAGTMSRRRTSPRSITSIRSSRMAILDAEYASAAAPSAAIVMATCRNTNSTGGWTLAIENLLNGPNPPAIVNMSYITCEEYLGAAGNAAVASAYQTGVAAGTSIFISAGDELGGACDYGGYYVSHGITVNGLASTPYDVAVGGTDFRDTYSGTNSVYWSSSNATNHGSAKSYIPEIPWNSSCGSQLSATHNGYATTYGASGFCNSATGESGDYGSDWGGSGGPSACASGSPSVSLVASGACQGYAKPSWQSGLLGVPNDGVRDLPDVSLFASFSPWLHGYVTCYSDTANGGTPCTTSPSGWSYDWGGTSFAAPIWAGIQALINQQAGGRQGNPNYRYYQLAAQEYGASGSSACNSSNGNSVASSCVFYDVTLGDIVSPCSADSSNGVLYNCYLPSGTYGVVSTSNASYAPAYPTATGWDFATGIGTVNVANLVANWIPAGDVALTVVEAGNGSGAVTSSPAGIYCGSTCQGWFASGAQATLTATASSGSSFAGWGGACSGTGACVVTMNAAKSVTATFTSPAATLSASIAGGGTVTSSPAGISCAPICSNNFAAGAQVSLAASAATGWTFSGWSGAGCSGTGVCNVTMNAAESVTATFTQSPALQASGPTIFSSGVQGGPFSPASFSYTLSATSGAVGFSVSNVPSWLTPSATSGTTPATVTFSVNANANGLSASTYSQSIAFTNTTNGAGDANAPATLVVASSASGLPQARTFVSSKGTDSGNCARAASCRSFAYALSQTVPHGEIDVLDTAGYGAATITQSVSIVNPGGVEAGVAANSGATALTIAAGPNDVVALRGLTIEGLKSGENGVLLTSGGALEMDDCVVRDFAGDAIALTPSGSTLFRLSNVTANDNGNDGIAVAGDNTTGGAVFVAVSNSVASDNGHYGLYSFSGSALSALAARRVAASDNLIGFYQSGSGGIVELGRSAATANNYGVTISGGLGLTFGDNTIGRNNAADVSGALGAVAKQ